MTMLPPPPERESFERQIKNLLSDGDVTQIARFIQKDRSLVSRMLNPDVPDKNNPFFLVCLILWAMLCIRANLFLEVWKIFTLEVEKFSACEPELATDAAVTTTNIGTQFCEFLHTELDRLSIDVQLKELVDVEDAVRIKKQELINRRSAQHFGGIG